MAKVILICGKICSGKTYYVKHNLKSFKAVSLSCDELDNMVFHKSLTDTHDAVFKDVHKYFHKKTVEIVNLGCNVVLDWGFWLSEQRKEVTKYYKDNNIQFEWHYIDINDEQWMKNIATRNELIELGKSDDYFVDEGLYNKVNKLFDIPTREEIDIWYRSEN